MVKNFSGNELRSLYLNPSRGDIETVIRYSKLKRQGNLKEYMTDIYGDLVNYADDDSDNSNSEDDEPIDSKRNILDKPQNIIDVEVITK